MKTAPPRRTARDHNSTKGFLIMAKYVISDGDISNNLKLENDSMFILKGGSADKTNVCDQSILNVSNGGLTGSTTVSSGGTMNILKGGSADYAFLYDDGRLIVSKGGFVGRAYLNGSGTATVCKGALADAVNVSSGGIAMLSGTVADVGVFDYGRVEICGGVIGSTLVSYHGSLVLSKGTINSASIFHEFDVYKGGTANNLKLQSATMTLFGGTVNDATLSKESYLYVNKGATANNVTVNADCAMTFFGGKATGVTVQDNAQLNLYGGSINGLSVIGCNVYAAGGGTLKDVTINEHGMIELDDATGSNFTIQDGAVTVYDGGKLIEATMLNADLNVYSGSIASKITAEHSEVYLTESGAKANGVTVRNDATLHVYEGTVAGNVTAEYRGRVFVNGTINGLTIGSGTSIGLGNVATATKVKWTPGDGNITIYDGASVKYTSKYSGVYVGAAGSHVSRTNVFEGALAMGDSAYVAKGGSAKGVVIGGMMEVWSGGKATDTVIKGGCSMTVSSGGTVYDTEVNGDLYLSGGSASGVTIEKNGCLHIASGVATAVEWTPFVGRLALGADAHVTFAGDVTGVYTGPDKWAENVEGITLAGYTDSMYVMSGGSADNTRIGYGKVYVFGGSVNNTVFTNDFSFDMGLMDLYDNASATNTVLKSGEIHVYSGAVMEHTTLRDALGSLYIHKSGSAVDTTLEKGCVYVSSGGYADVVKLMNGNFTVLNGGTANHVSACSGSYMDAGTIRVSSGAVVSSLVLERGSYLYVEKGAKVVNVTSGYGSVIVTEKGATIKKVTKGTVFESDDSDGDEKNGNGWKDKKKKTVYDSVLDSTATEIDIHTNRIQFDGKAMTDYKYYDNFVGYGDEIDFIKIRLDVPAELSFSITATDAAKFTIWRWDDKKEKMVSLQSTTLKDITATEDKDGNVFYAETKALLLTGTEDYYLSVESTNASKGAYAYYDVYLNNDDSTFYNKGDHSDDWTDLADNGPNSTLYGNAGVISGVENPLVEDNWVGFDDGIDYMTFSVKDDVSMSFCITADDAVKFTVFSIYDNEDGWDTVTLLTKTVKPKKAGTEKTEFTAECQFVGDNEKTYFFSVEYLNKKNVGSGANYSVYVETYDLLTVPDAGYLDEPGFVDIQPFEPGDDSNGCALDMPESFDATLSLQDSLNFGQYASDALADASAFDTPDGSKSLWQDALLA